MPHLTIELYRMILEGTLPPRTLARALHQHMVQSCPECAEEWKAASALGLSTGRAVEREPASEPKEAIAFSPAARRLDDRAKEVRKTRKQAQQDLWRLLRHRPEAREELIINARTRYRSRAFVELLIEHCRERVRSAPREAADLLELVPISLLWMPDGTEGEWVDALQVRGEAHRANALRAAGDLPQAEIVFAEARRRLARFALADSRVYAEVATLEASLRWDQARNEEAMTLLDQAVLIYQEAGEREGLARALIKRASISQELERLDQALGDLERARGLVDRQEHGFLYLCTVVAGVPILLDLQRFEEAERVLLDAEESFEAATEPWWALRFRYLQGRAALGLGDVGRAERLLADARQGFLDQVLPQDTANASLDLALVHLQQGRTAEVRRLCREVAPYFQGCGVEREALATLTLFQRATTADAATLAHLSRLRRHLAAAQAPAARRAGAGE